MFLLLVVVIFWGLSWYAIALQLGEVHPLVSIAWRFYIAGLVLLGWLALRKQFIAPKKPELLRLFALSLCLFCLNFTSFYFATGYVTSGLISVVFATAVFMTVFNQWIWARVTPEPKTLLGAIFGVSGLALIFAPSILESTQSGHNNALIGLSLSLLGTWFFSVGNLVSASLSKTAHLPSSIACAMLIGASVSAVIATFLGESLALPWHNTTYLLALAYLAIGASVVAFVAYLTLVATQGADKAGYATVLFPIIALVVSTIFEDYQWRPSAAIGVTMATVGAMIVFYPKRR